MHEFASQQIDAFPLGVIFKLFGTVVLKKVFVHPVKNLESPSCKL